RPVEGNKSDESIAAKTVSLLVTPDEAETIALASDLGRIRLVLRNPDDEQMADTNGTEEGEIFRHDSKPHAAGAPSKGGGILDWLKSQQRATEPAPAATPAPAPVPVPDPEEHFRMDLLKGDEVSHVEFSRKNKDDRWINNSPDGTNNAASPAV